jgi:hypothetical protein
MYGLRGLNFMGWMDQPCIGSLWLLFALYALQFFFELAICSNNPKNNLCHTYVMNNSNKQIIYINDLILWLINHHVDQTILRSLTYNIII